MAVSCTRGELHGFLPFQIFSGFRWFRLVRECQLETRFDGVGYLSVLDLEGDELEDVAMVASAQAVRMRPDVAPQERRMAHYLEVVKTRTGVDII